MTKEELLRKYESDRDSTIAKYREEFLQLEKRSVEALNKLREEFLKSLDNLVVPVEVVKEEVKEEVEEIPLVIFTTKGDSKKTEGKKEEMKIPGKRGSKSSWNMHCKG